MHFCGLCLSSRRRYTGGKTEEQQWVFFIQTTGNTVINQSINHIILYWIILWSDCFCIQRCGSAVSVAAGAETALDRPVRHKEAWPDTNHAHISSCGPSPDHKPAASPPSKPIRTKPPSPVAPPPLAPLPHCIQGSLRHADFQHNGERQHWDCYQ